MTLIDLGEIRPVIPTPRPSRLPFRRLLVRARQPWVVRIGMPLVTAMLLASSAVAGSAGGGVRVPVGTGANMFVSGGTVLVADYRQGLSRLASYDLSSGTRRWSVPLDLFAGATRFAVQAGVVVASSYSVGATATETEAFDLATGSVRWKSQFSLGRIVAGSVVLTSTDEDEGDTFYRADLATGSLLWSAEIPAECSYAYAPDAIAVGCAVDSDPGAIRMRLIDVRTGSTRAVRVEPHAVNTVVSGHDTFTQLPAIDVVGGLVVVTDLSVTPSRVTAYRSTDLSEAWSAAQPTILAEATPAPDSSNYLLVPVGPQAVRVKATPVAVLPPGATFPAPSQLAPVVAPVWLRHRGAATPLLHPLPGAGPGRCVQVTTYLACATATRQMTFWTLPS